MRGAASDCVNLSEVCGARLTPSLPVSISPVEEMAISLLFWSQLHSFYKHGNIY